MLENRQGICGFLCEGHAGYAEEDEADVICAAVTAIAGTTVAALTDILELEVDYDFRPGHLKCEVQTVTQDATLLLETFALGVKQIEYSYSSDFVHMEDALRS